jgi:hypothetical protein
VGVVLPPDETEGAMAVPSQNSIAKIVSDEKGERQRRTLPPCDRGYRTRPTSNECPVSLPD